MYAQLSTQTTPLCVEALIPPRQKFALNVCFIPGLKRFKRRLKQTFKASTDATLIPPIDSNAGLPALFTIASGESGLYMNAVFTIMKVELQYILTFRSNRVNGYDAARKRRLFLNRMSCFLTTTMFLGLLPRLCSQHSKPTCSVCGTWIKIDNDRFVDTDALFRHAPY